MKKRFVAMFMTAVMMTGVVACGNSDEKKNVATDNNSKETVSEEIKGNDVKENSEPENDEEWFAELANKVNEGCKNKDISTCRDIEDSFCEIQYDDSVVSKEIVNAGTEAWILIYFDDGNLTFDYKGNIAHVVEKLKSNLGDLSSPRALNMTCYYLSWSVNENNTINENFKTISDEEAGEISEKYKKMLEANEDNTISNTNKEDDKNQSKTKRTTKETIELLIQSFNENDYDTYSTVSLEEYIKKDGFHPEVLDEIESYTYEFKGINHSYIVNSYEEIVGTGMEGFCKEIMEEYEISEEEIEGIGFQEYKFNMNIKESGEELDVIQKHLLFKLDGTWYISEDIYC